MSISSQVDLNDCKAIAKKILAEKWNIKEILEDNILSINYDSLTNKDGCYKGVTRFIKQCSQKFTEKIEKQYSEDISILNASYGQAKKVLHSPVGSKLGYCCLIIILVFMAFIYSTFFSSFVFSCFVAYLVLTISSV